MLQVASTGAETRSRRSYELGIPPSGEGLLITFESWPGYELALTSLDPLRAPPELVAVRTVQAEDGEVELATVHVPQGSLSYFLERVDQYEFQDHPRWGGAMHARLMESIHSVRLATIEALWTDPVAEFPELDLPIWWEVWLRVSDGHEADRLRSYAAIRDLSVSSRQLTFDRRTIVLVRATARELSEALELIDDFAELRHAPRSPNLLVASSAVEQADLILDLVARTSAAGSDAPAICILDTGVNRGHPLLEHSLAEQDTHTAYPTWGSHDHDGHGTAMAGLTLYGDLRQVVEGGSGVSMVHVLESVKIIPPVGARIPDAMEDLEQENLFAALTAEAVARVEVQEPERDRAFALAVTIPPGGTAGAPSTWSSSIDALATGRSFDILNNRLNYLDDASAEEHRLFLISAGNVKAPDGSYLDRCDAEPIEDPAQAWNAITIGACTDLWDISDEGSDYEDWTVIGAPGDLSPYSRTSVAFNDTWPLKPEIVLEGGNAALSPTGSESIPLDSISVLTTSGAEGPRLLTTFGQTSAATAQAAFLASSIAAEYPNLWPETVRALLVHGAEWTDAMQARFKAAGTNKHARVDLVRRYGYGVPTLERCRRSATNALTLVAQDTIHPYRKTALNEMHTHDLPWPKEALKSLGGAPVRLRVTLSYFVEPNPTRRGRATRYRYASHRLQFELRRALETPSQFSKRLNKKALAADEARPKVGDEDDWYLGSNAHNLGSIHSDFWHGTAEDLADRGAIAVYPVTGWWKELPSRDRSDLGVRYGLVVSIDTPVEEIDLWTPVALSLGIPIVTAV